MPQQLFVFLQFEFPWALGPSDGRYLIRDGPDGEPQRVVVIESLSARTGPQERPRGWLSRRAAGRERDVEPEPEPAPADTTRVTSVDPVPLSAEGQAQAWLDGLDRERDVQDAVAVVNRVLHAHRIASADPYLREVAAAQALTVRAGWGEGEQVASGRWLHARELALDKPGRGGRRRERSWALRPQERLAALLGGRNEELLCEELTLRARLDLDQGRTRHAAVALQAALASAVRELDAAGGGDLALRVAELRKLGEQVQEQAQAVLAGSQGALDGELVAHTLGRLEAALRARSAAGFNLR